MKGCIHIYTGEGKGKTTAALGLAVRALGHGRQVVMIQFLKGVPTGEWNILDKLEQMTLLHLQKPYPFFSQMTEMERQEVTAAHNQYLQQALTLAAEGKCQMLILDEVMAAVRHQVVDASLVERLLAEKPQALELVLTGRNAPAHWLEKADYVTEMIKRKHPFDQGTAAREGVEY